MAYEQRDNSGSLFKNDRREKDTHPQAKGSALIDGVEYWVSAWTKEARDGNKYQSLSFTKKNADHTGSAARQEPGYSGSYNGDPRTNSSGGYSQRPAPMGLDEDPPF